MSKRFNFLFVLGLCVSTLLSAQTISTQYSPSYLVQNVFLGQGVQVSNVTFQGDSTLQIGKFFDFTTIGIDSGIVLSTGNVNNITNLGPNASTPIQSTQNFPNDPDIIDIVQTNNPGIAANDAAILEFDFTPLGDSVRFDYIFGSEEYPEFVCSFNDGFGMFLSGPGITGPYTNNAVNIALIPGTSIPVSIYTINQTTGTCAWANSNTQYYVPNVPPVEFAYDGYTTVLRAEYPVTCGQPYHLKIAIADAGDFAYDSGVLLKARSLFSNQVAIEAVTLSGDSTLVEGCAAGSFVFVRPGSLADTLVVPVTISGTATNGVDYAPIPTSITFLPGQNLITLPVTPIQDNVTEGIESIIVSITQIGCTGVFNTITQTLYIVPPTPIVAALSGGSICPGETITLTATHTGGYAPLQYAWQGLPDTTASIQVTPTQNTTYTVTITDGCTGSTSTATASVAVVQLEAVLVNVNNANIIESCGSFTVDFSIGNTFNQPYTFPVTISGTAINGVDYTQIPSTVTIPTGSTSTSLTIQALSDALTEPQENIVITVTFDQPCLQFSSSQEVFIVDGAAPPTVNITSTNQTCPGDAITLTANTTGGSGTYQFSWPGPGGNQNLDAILVSPTTNTSYIVVVSDQLCGGTVTVSDTIQIIVPVIPPVSINPILNQTVLCPGNITTLTPVVTGGNGSYTFNWLPGGQSTSSITVNPNITTNYILTATSVCGTTDSIHVRVNVPVYNGLSLIVRDTTVQCAGNVGTVIALATGGAPGKRYSFNGGGFLSGNQFSLPVPNTLDVIVIVKDTCNTQARDTATITVPQRAPVVALGGVDTAACPGQFAYLSVVGQGGLAPYTYQWSAFSGNDTIVNPLADTTSVITRGSHDYRIVITDVCGTTAEDTIAVEMKVSCSISIPNVFTPNGTGGNERFIITGIQEYPNTKVSIYDRWGTRVQQWDNYTNDNAWDGKGVDTGTYFYTVEFVGTRKPLNGFVTLLR